MDANRPYHCMSILLSFPFTIPEEPALGSYDCLMTRLPSPCEQLVVAVVLGCGCSAHTVLCPDFGLPRATGQEHETQLAWSELS